MKKALDYVSDYQLKSACKDAICIAPSKVTQMIFAVLEDWYHHIVLTHSFQLVSFLHIGIYLLFYCQKSGNEPDACKKGYQDPYLYLLPFKSRTVYLRSGTERWMCLLLLLLLLRCCLLSWKSRLAVVDFDWCHLIAHFVLKFVAMATRVGGG